MRTNTLFYEDHLDTKTDSQILTGDSLEVLPTLPPEFVQCCVTSPPYWGLRDYDHPGQIGAESSPESYVDDLVAIFREVRRVLRKDGTLWLNIGDGYARNGGTGSCGPNAVVGNTKKLIQRRNCKVSVVSGHLVPKPPSPQLGGRLISGFPGWVLSSVDGPHLSDPNLESRHTQSQRHGLRGWAILKRLEPIALSYSNANPASILQNHYSTHNLLP